MSGNHAISDIRHAVVHWCTREPTGISCVSYVPQIPVQDLYCQSDQCRVKIEVTWENFDLIPAEAVFYAVQLCERVRFIDPKRRFCIHVRIGQCSRCGHAYYALARERIP